MLSVTLLSVLAMPLAFDPKLEQLNTPANEVSVAFSADGTEAWLERQGGRWGRSAAPRRLYHYTRPTADSDWSAPVALHLTGESADHGDPYFDDATQTLYFTSVPDVADAEAGGMDIWRAERRDGAWQRPERLPAGINGPGREYSPVRRGDRLYFVSDRTGDGDVYVAEPDGLDWAVRQLGAAINSPGGEWNVWVSADERLMLFESSGRPGNVSPAGDLYASVRDADGRWMPAVPLERLNGPGSELNARLIGDRLIHASTSPHPEHADLYAVRTDAAQVVARAYRQQLHVVNRSGHDLVSVDLAAGAIERRLAIGPGPHLVSAAAAGLAVAAYGVYPTPHAEPVETMPGWVSETGGALLVVDTAGDARRLEVDCRHPHGTAWDRAGRRLWVTCEDRQGIVQLDFQEDPPGRRFLTTGRDGAHVVVFAPHRERLLVAHTAAGGVAIMRPDGDEIQWIATGAGSEALWVDAEHDLAWVTIGPSDAIAVIDLEDPETIARVDPSCRFPIDFAAGPRGSLWVACIGSSELVAFDRDRRTVTDRLALPAGPLNIEPHPSLPVLYASLPRRNEVAEISLIGRGVTRTFRTGIEPDGLAFLPAAE